MRVTKNSKRAGALKDDVSRITQVEHGSDGRTHFLWHRVKEIGGNNRTYILA